MSINLPVASMKPHTRHRMDFIADLNGLILKRMEKMGISRAEMFKRTQVPSSLFSTMKRNERAPGVYQLARIEMVIGPVWEHCRPPEFK